MHVSNVAADPSLAAPAPTPTSPAVLEPAVTPLVKVPLFMPKFLLVGETATSSKSEVPAFMVPHKAPSVDTSEDLLPKNMFDPTSKVSSFLFISCPLWFTSSIFFLLISHFDYGTFAFEILFPSL